MSQNQRILNFLERGKRLTPLSALRMFDCMRLGARVHELRGLGFDIQTENLILSTGKRIARYRLAA